MGTPQPVTEAELQAAREGRSAEVMRERAPRAVTQPPSTSGGQAPRPITEAELRAAREGRSGPKP